MSKRSATFNSENLALLFQAHPWLSIFSTNYCMEYIRLTADLYDLIEENGSKLNIGAAEGRARSAFSSFQNPDFTTKEFFERSFQVWRTFRDSHDGEGNRLIHTTPEGRGFLEVVQRLILQKSQFTAVGADRMLMALNMILTNPEGLTKEQAIEKHRTEIEKLTADIKRIEDGGLQASEILTGRHSPIELFMDAQEVAASFLVAAHKLKNDIRAVRARAFEDYVTTERSVGEQIELAFIFHKELQATETYKSYIRARELLSNFGDDDSQYPNKNIERILYTIRERGLIAREVIQQSPLARFTTEFKAINQEIEEEISRQINMLRLQVYYATVGENQLVNQYLRELSTLLFQNGHQSMAFLDKYQFRVFDGLDIGLNSPRLNSFEISEKLKIGAIREANMTSAEEFFMYEQMKKVDEASIRQILIKLKKVVFSQGSITLSQYEITMGVTEYYVLSQISNFDKTLKGTELESILFLPVSNGSGDKLWMVEVPDVRIEIA